MEQLTSTSYGNGKFELVTHKFAEFGPATTGHDPLLRLSAPVGAAVVGAVVVGAVDGAVVVGAAVVGAAVVGTDVVGTNVVGTGVGAQVASSWYSI